MPRELHEHHFVRSMRTSTANKTTAFGFSLALAGSYAALVKVRGEPTWLGARASSSDATGRLHPL
jgi:hypothetical protein